MNKLKKIILMAALVIAGSLHQAAAMNYSATHLLLIFREDGFPDAEFDLGSVSNYLNLASGTTVTVNYPTQVKTNYNNTFNGIRIALLAATSSSDSLLRVWMTDADTSSTPTDVSGSKYTVLRGRIDGVGDNAAAVTGSNAAPYIVSPSDPNSYSYTVTQGTLENIDTIGGVSYFSVEAVNPATLAFYDVRNSGVTPKPPARLIGTFNWDASGNLTFTAGAQVPLSPSKITNVGRTNAVTTVWFTTTNGLNYSLFSSTSVTGGWSQVAGPIAGQNGSTNFTHTTADSVRFYQIQSSH